MRCRGHAPTPSLYTRRGRLRLPGVRNGPRPAAATLALAYALALLRAMALAMASALALGLETRPPTLRPPSSLPTLSRQLARIVERWSCRGNTLPPPLPLKATVDSKFLSESQRAAV